MRELCKKAQFGFRDLETLFASCLHNHPATSGSWHKDPCWVGWWVELVHDLSTNGLLFSQFFLPSRYGRKFLFCVASFMASKTSCGLCLTQAQRPMDSEIAGAWAQAPRAIFSPSSHLLSYNWGTSGWPVQPGDPWLSASVKSNLV